MTARTRRPPLTREHIVEGALAIIDTDGPEGLTMRRLGQWLSVDPMAVYHHLPNKAAVLDGIVEYLWDGVKFPPRQPREGWQEVLAGVFAAFRLRLLEHPRAVAVIGSRPSVSPAMLRVVEAILRRLEDAGLGGTEAMQLVDCLSGYTIGKVLAETSDLAGGHAEHVGAAVAALTPQTHPTLVAALAGGYTFAPEVGFNRGLRALINGW